MPTALTPAANHSPAFAEARAYSALAEVFGVPAGADDDDVTGPDVRVAFQILMYHPPFAFVIEITGRQPAKAPADLFRPGPRFLPLP